jgi:hypothetical protein
VSGERRYCYGDLAGGFKEELEVRDGCLVLYFLQARILQVYL